MKQKILLTLLLTAFIIIPTQAQTDNGHYIEVTGTSEIEIAPDKIHYIIELKEYFLEEFDGKSEPREYKTKIPLADIEKDLRTSLEEMGIPNASIRTQEVGNYQREKGNEFLISKRLDIKLDDFKQVDNILKIVDTKGVNSMHIAGMNNKDILTYHEKGKVNALKAAQKKAAYLTEALGKRIGKVIRIVEPQDRMSYPTLSQISNVYSSDVEHFKTFRTIKMNYSMLVRFEIID